MSEVSTTRSLLAAFRALAEPVVEREGLDLVAVELIGGQPRIARVSVDRVGGVDVGDCARVSRRLSEVLDAEDPVAGAYTLEVSSPGIDRPVQREADFARFVGCTVRVKTFGMDGRRRVTGVILGAEGGVVRLKIAEEARSYPISDIERANLVLTLEQYARLGEGLHPIEQESHP